jgi:peptidoglycan/LPS O-acetylase OafA/YrhL
MVLATDLPVGRAETDQRRPHLDGLRTIAVYLVVAFHSGIGRASGGFIGVDVFFVLSGYLVTEVLLRDLSGGGGVHFRRFYSRRMRRLLPAAAINLVVTCLVFTVIAPPATVQQAVASVNGAALYVSNWVFIAQSTDYFGPEVDQSPVAHYWSLSVEEQFYFVWPLLLAGLFVIARRFGRRERTIVRIGVAIGAAASLTAALVLAGQDQDRAYFGTDTRAYQLFFGALLALTPGIVTRLRERAGRAMPWVSGVALAALVVAASSVVDLGPVTRGALAAALTIGALVALEASHAGWVRRGLSWEPITYLGRISYGTYLWHWIIVLALADAYDLGGLATFAVVAALATGLAALSYELVERPIRLQPVFDGHRRAVIFSGLALSVLIGLVIAPTILDRDVGEEQVVAAATEGTPVDVDWAAAKFDVLDVEDCEPGAPKVCPRVEGDGEKVLIVGESHAIMITPLMEEIARRRGLELSALYLPYCPWTDGVQYKGVARNCFDDQRDAFETVIPAYDPDIVVLAHRPIDDPQNPIAIAAEDVGPVEGQAGTEALAASVEDVVRGLVDGGQKVVIVEPVAAAPVDEDPIACLSEARFLEECRFVASPGPLAEERVMRDLDDEFDGVWSLDLDPLACPYLPICDPVVGGQVVRKDTHHLTTTFATSLADPVEAYLVDNGVLASP